MLYKGFSIMFLILGIVMIVIGVRKHELVFALFSILPFVATVGVYLLGRAMCKEEERLETDKSKPRRV